MKLIHHPDDALYLGEFRCTLSELQAEQADYPALAAGQRMRVYGDGQSLVFTVTGDQRPGPMPWPAGEAILGNAAAIRAAIEARRAAAPAPAPPAGGAIQAELRMLREKYDLGSITPADRERALELLVRLLGS